MVWLALAGWSEERSGLVQMSGGGLAGTGWLVRGKVGSSTNVWRWFGWHWLAGQRKGRVKYKCLEVVWLALAGWSEERSGLVQMSGGGLAGTGWLVRGKVGSSTNVWRWFGWHWLAGQRKGRV